MDPRMLAPPGNHEPGDSWAAVRAMETATIDTTLLDGNAFSAAYRIFGRVSGKKQAARLWDWDWRFKEGKGVGTRRNRIMFSFGMKGQGWIGSGFYVVWTTDTLRCRIIDGALSDSA